MTNSFLHKKYLFRCERCRWKLRGRQFGWSVCQAVLETDRLVQEQTYFGSICFDSCDDAIKLCRTFLIYDITGWRRRSHSVEHGGSRGDPQSCGEASVSTQKSLQQICLYVSSIHRSIWPKFLQCFKCALAVQTTRPVGV